MQLIDCIITKRNGTCLKANIIKEETRKKLCTAQA